MKKNRKGFTLVELLVVITILGIIMTIAIPSIFNVNKKMKQKSLDSKIEMIEKAAVIYAQNNSNSIKANPEATLQCEGTDCNYIYTITLEELVELGEYESEENSNGCDVSNPIASEYCLDCSTIKIKLDDNYKTATAELTVDDTKLTTYTCS